MLSLGLHLPIRHVSCGADFCLILLSDGTLLSCGVNESKQLGITQEQLKTCDYSEYESCVRSNNNTNEDIGTTVKNTLTERRIYQVKLLESVKIKMMECGSHYALMVSENNDLYGMGVNDYNQICLGETYARYPSLIDYNRSVDDEITHVGCCFSYSLFVLNSRTLRLIGQNWVYHHDIDHKLSSGRLSPKQNFHVFDCNVKKLCTGGFHFVILLQDGTVYGGDCGSNQYGNFEQENQNTIFYEITQKYFKNVKIVDICCGGDNSAFLTTNGELYVCGLDHFQYSCNSMQYDNMTRVEFKKPIVKMFTGDNYSCVVLDNGSIIFRGKNDKHQLGSLILETHEHTFHMKDLFPKLNDPKDIAVACGYYNTVIYCRKSLAITKHFLFIEKRINDSHLSDIVFQCIQ
ncbi:hypothetical protein FDP41_007558 [Naegleria fowleri]|uniref:Uncharacterized protein n=1 Tax=Naegleria fowleri TaxID=5763 RepID=A0A6A5BZQ5_NAEFO|nr:uncharacterized protein FDP41_007558 [Naegleria fowleri]KAF0983643.1 hypothetical protein FDP41_007558 [Naegleria fowleri]